MSGYNYGPPPPPPPPQASQSSHPGYGHHGGHYQHHGSSRGGGHPARGRAGYASGGRPEYQSSPRYEYSGQQHYASHPSGYSNPQHQAGGYAPAHPQWSQDHSHPPAQQQPQPQPHAPAPLSSTNYHPNYAPQSYTGAPPQPPSAHPPSYGAPPPPQTHQPYHYPAPAPAPVPAPAPAPAPVPVAYSSPQSWGGHDRSQPPQYGGGSHRGGHGGERGGSRTPSMGAPVRGEYGTPHMQPQVSGAYAQPYPDPRSGASYPPQPQYTQYPPPPPPPSSHMQTPGREPYYKHDGRQQSGRGRGGSRGGGNMRGKSPHHGGDKMRPRHEGHQGNQGNQGHHGHRPDGASFQKQDHNSSGKKKKRKTNTLGLTPGQDSDSEDDEKEEDALCKLLGQDALDISDIASYVAERKKNFPTASRAKQAKKNNVETTNGAGDKRAAALEKEELMAIELRKQLEKVESSIKRKREKQDEGDEMRDGPVSGANSDNDQPEVLSTRPQQLPPPPPPAKRADVTKHCKYFSTGGTCGKKGKCRFVHDPAVREAAIKERDANNGQLTLQQRLVLNDKDQEDLTVLQSIHYLREKGLVSEGTGKGAQEDQDSNRPSHARPQSTSSLPAAPPSLPKPPIKREHGLPSHTPPPSALQLAKSGGQVQYKGWNLSGYGNSGLKTEDLP